MVHHNQGEVEEDLANLRNWMVVVVQHNHNQWVVVVDMSWMVVEVADMLLKICQMEMAMQEQWKLEIREVQYLAACLLHQMLSSFLPVLVE